MMALLKFLHMVGIAAWLGGAFAAVTLALGLRNETPPARAGGFRLIGRLHSIVVAPGALVTVLSGFALTGKLASMGLGGQLGSPAVAAMQGLGLLAGLIALFIAFPTAQKLGAISQAAAADPVPPALFRVRNRLVSVSVVTGVLALAALYFGVA